MGRTACTEPQCLYKGALYLYIASLVTSLQLIIILIKQIHLSVTKELVRDI